MNSALWYIAGILTVYFVHKLFDIWGKHMLNNARMKKDNMQAVVASMNHDALLKWRDIIDKEIAKRKES